MAFSTSYSLATTLSETRANTYTSGQQTLPDVTSLSDGGYVVAYNTAVGDGYILLNFFNAESNVVGTFKIPYAGGTKAIGQPSITELANGNVMVVWDENNAGEQSLKAGLFTSTGTALITDIALTGTDAGFETPDITALSGGGFVVTYTYAGNSWVGAYNDVGVQLGGFVQVDSIGSGNQIDPVVTGLADGGFAVAFVDDSTGNLELYTRTFNANGTSRSAQVLVDSFGDNSEPAIAAMKNGNFAIVYTDSGWINESGTDGISLVIVNANGAVVSSIIHVNDTTSGAGKDEAEPSVTVLENGYIVVSWTYPFSGADQDIYGRIYDQNGNPVTIDGNAGDFVLTSSGTADMASEIAGLLSGEFVTVWQDTVSDGSSGRITREENELTRYTTGDNSGNVLQGDELRDIIVGGSGIDTIYGDGGSDWLYQLEGGGQIWAGDGAVDVSLGGGGVDTIYGEGGFDYMYGYGANDTLYGGDGVDVAYGGAGADTIYGNADTDWLFGGTEGDVIYGGSEADLLFGESGSDYIQAGSGNDWIWGGTQGDQFAFLDGWGGDVIYDFEDGLDSFDLSGTSATSFADITVGQISGGFTWFAYGGDVVYLWGMGGTAPGAANITAADFIF